MALAAAFILIWINLAVGIIGDEGDFANLMYVGVLAAGIIRAIITRGQPPGMARTLSVMAFAHALVPVIALIFLKITPNSGTACLIIFDVNSFVMMQSFCSLLRPALMRTLPVLALASYAQGAVVDPAQIGGKLAAIDRVTPLAQPTMGKKVLVERLPRVWSVA